MHARSSAVHNGTRPDNRPGATLSSIEPKLAETASACCVQLRFARFGRKGVPFYRLVAIDSRAQRDGKPIEVRAAAALPSIAAV